MTELKFIHERKITEMYFYEGMNAYQINRYFKHVFSLSQIARFLAMSNAQIDNGFIVVQSLNNFI